MSATPANSTDASTHRVPLAHRVLLGVVACCVLLLSLPDKRRLVCMLRSGSTSCCCVAVDGDDAQQPAAHGCCQQAAADDERDGGLGDGGLDDGDLDDGDEHGDRTSRRPCECGDALPDAPPGNDDVPDGSKHEAFAMSAPPQHRTIVTWPEPAPTRRGVAYQVPPRPTGPPLYVRFERFLI